MKDFGKYAVDIRQHVIVPKPQNTITQVFQDLCPDRVAFVICMLATVNFDDQSALYAAEVGNKPSYGPLAPKLRTAELTIT